MSAPDITIAVGIDQARRSGWGIGRVGIGAPAVVAHGVAETHEEHQFVVDQALALAEGNIRKVLVMYEDHSGMSLTRLTRYDRDTVRRGRQGAPERSLATYLGMGAARGYWNAFWDGVGHPERLRDEVEPRTWRARVLGTTRGDTEQLKHLARTWATAYLGEPIEDADEAEGIAICAFSMLDGIARLEARRQKARLYARGRREERRQLELVRVDGRLR